MKLESVKQSKEQTATKPAHTPSAGAMRAARALAVSKPLIDAIHSGAGQYGIAQIIDRETAHAELVEALECLVNIISKDPQLLERYCEVSDASLGDAINLLERLAKSQA